MEVIDPQQWVAFGHGDDVQLTLVSTEPVGALFLHISNTGLGHELFNG